MAPGLVSPRTRRISASVLDVSVNDDVISSGPCFSAASALPLTASANVSARLRVTETAGVRESPAAPAVAQCDCEICVAVPNRSLPCSRTTWSRM